MSFYVGQKVACVNDSNQRNASLLTQGDAVVQGRVYVIRDALDAASIGNPFISGVAVRLFGVVGGFYPDGEEAVFWGTRFRPLDELKAESKARFYKENPELQPA